MTFNATSEVASSRYDTGHLQHSTQRRVPTYGVRAHRGPGSLSSMIDSMAPKPSSRLTTGVKG